jgi:hypothetical protein
MKPGGVFAVITQGTKLFGYSMAFYRRLGFAALALLCSGSLASAGNAHFLASDDFVLTGAQEALIWQRVGRENTANAGAACRFNPMIDTAVPASGALHSLPATIVAQIPMVKPYRYTTVGKCLLLVNPSDRRIVDIISP